MGSESQARSRGSTLDVEHGTGTAYLSLLIDTLFFGARKRDPLAMFSVYFDESGTHQKSNIWVLAGLVAPPSQWQRLAAEWQKVLDDEKLPYFHATECNAGAGIFKGWERERREKIALRLAKIIRRRVHWRTWAALALNHPSPLFFDPRRIVPYPACALACTYKLRALAIEKRPDTRVNYVFASGGKGSGVVFHGLGKIIGTKKQEDLRIGTLSTDTPKNLIPLQAADLHAYEIYRYFSDQMLGQKEIRSHLAELLPIPEAGGGGCFFDHETMSKWQAKAKVQKRRGEVWLGWSAEDLPTDILNAHKQPKLVMIPITPPPPSQTTPPPTTEPE